MFAGNGNVHGNMRSNVLVNVQRTPYKILLQMHVLFDILTATVQLTVTSISRNNISHAIQSCLGCLFLLIY